MTREQAIKELQESHDIMRSYDIDESESRLMTALNMAIKALEQEPTTKDDFRDCKSCSHSKDGKCAGTEECHLCMWKNQYTPTTKNDLGVDCISRDDVRDVMQELWGTSGELMDRLMALPSVTPQPKTGHWIWCVGSHKCSNCEEYTCFSHKKLLRYCPNCGAKMTETEQTDGQD